MTPILTPAQEDLLISLVVADRSARARTGAGDRFAWHRSGGMGPTELLHRGAVPGQTIDGADMEALIGCGLLERTGQRAAVLTPGATRLGLRLERARGVQVPVEVTWPGAEPVLQALWDTWASLAGPPLGAPLEEIAAEVDDEPAAMNFAGQVNHALQGQLNQDLPAIALEAQGLDRVLEETADALTL